MPARHQILFKATWEHIGGQRSAERRRLNPNVFVSGAVMWNIIPAQRRETSAVRTLNNNHMGTLYTLWVNRPVCAVKWSKSSVQEETFQYLAELCMKTPVLLRGVSEFYSTKPPALFSFSLSVFFSLVQKFICVWGGLTDEFHYMMREQTRLNL